MKDEFDKIRQRTYQYWYVDGLYEIVFAGLCLLLSVYFYLQATLPPQSLFHRILEASLVIVLVGGSLLTNHILMALKTRLTYPRTGYVHYQVKGRKNILVAVLVAMGMGSLVMALMAMEPKSLDWMPAITGLIVGFVWFIVAIRIGLVRFYLMSLYSILVGMGLAFAGFGDVLGLSYYYGGLCLAMAVSGGITLQRYLHQPQLKLEEIDEQ